MSSPLTRGERGALRSVGAAFTLIELLTVIAIIGILAAITFGVARGVQERAAMSKARAELAVIATALDAYKRHYGDYPQTATGTWTGLTSSETRLLQALIGKRGPQGDSINGKSFVDVTKLTLSSDSDPFEAANQNSVTLQDPWGRNYLYRYKVGGSDWKVPSFVLLSVGPDGLAYGTSTTDGFLESDGRLRSDVATNAGSADNIFAR